MDQELKTYLDEKFKGIDHRFEVIDQRFEAIDQRFEGIDQRLDERREQTNRQTQLLIESSRSDLQAVAEGHGVIRLENDRRLEEIRERRREDLATVETTLAALRRQG